MPDTIDQDYDPLLDTGSYMNSKQLKYFKNLLETQKNELLETIKPKIESVANPDFASGDEGDITANEIQRGINLRLGDRQSKLIKKIDEALLRIDNGDYGYCSVTGNEIGIKRLIARPMTNFCIEEQNRRDIDEKIHENYEEAEYLLNLDAPVPDDD
ncbi:RNA polymerase-binding protein DksA [Candidatus Deianiraea vastatrix]|uniref:RNA polymerase-binding transcription factor DksA n=1 Tax=Candidatus Deianiraea vastatrix TaxID=2163644 RepID=A0A5B8XJE1_9RICK|nr:RNA polymerase-binding protein DksA [Candidatus Deianiraea vastatrix]QED23697.1 RNA polymerase-binding transcription factor DksA [Candidatus Deianiraea vastatrix]